MTNNFYKYWIHIEIQWNSFNLTAVLADLIERFQAKFQTESHFGIFLEGVRPKRTGIWSDQMGVEAVELEDWTCQTFGPVDRRRNKPKNQHLPRQVRTKNGRLWEVAYNLKKKLIFPASFWLRFATQKFAGKLVGISFPTKILDQDTGVDAGLHIRGPETLLAHRTHRGDDRGRPSGEERLGGLWGSSQPLRFWLQYTPKKLTFC